MLGGGPSRKNACIHRAQRLTVEGRVLCLKDGGLSPAGRKTRRLSPLWPSALGTPFCPFCDGSQTPHLGSPRVGPAGVEGQVPGMPTWPCGPAQKADKPLLPGWLLPLPVCIQPAQQEAGRGPGQLVPVTLYQTRNRLRDQKSEQSSWRRCEAFPCHLCLTAALLHSFCGFLAQSLAHSGRSFSLAFKD